MFCSRASHMAPPGQPHPTIKPGLPKGAGRDLYLDLYPILIP